MIDNFKLTPLMFVIFFFFWRGEIDSSNNVEKKKQLHFVHHCMSKKHEKLKQSVLSWKKLLIQVWSLVQTPLVFVIVPFVNQKLLI